MQKSYIDDYLTQYFDVPPYPGLEDGGPFLAVSFKQAQNY